MVDVTVIILTKNEELHLGRCLERLRALGPRRVVVVDSESTDATADLARREGAEVVIHPWPGNQAAQFNWALDNLPIQTEWVLRLDADEYLSPELTEEIRAKLPEMPADVSALVLPLGRYFLNRRLRHGIVNGIAMVRMFRRGCCRYEQRLMDEHLQILSGRALTLTHPFYDHSLLPLSAFIAKHNGYADREAALLLAEKYRPQSADADKAGALADAVATKRRQRSLYGRMPLFWRSTAYFLYRYIIRLGFLDGKEGFLWDFLQGWWYRTLVDAKVMEVERACGNDREKIRQHLSEHYGISI